VTPSGGKIAVRYNVNLEPIARIGTGAWNFGCNARDTDGVALGNPNASFETTSVFSISIETISKKGNLAGGAKP
jgi:hypothetical protein